MLFIEAGTKYKKSNKNIFYTDGNFNEKIWERYNSYCDKLEIIGRKENKIYDDEYAKNKFNRVINTSNLVLLEDIYSSKIGFISLIKRKKVSLQLEEEIKKNDFIIIRSITKFYTFEAVKICRKLGKNYLIEITGSAFDSLWYRGDWYGKILAIPTEIKKKIEVKKAKNILYVTNKFLQKEYPNFNNNIGCSDVEIKMDEESFAKRQEKYKKLILKQDNITIGTIGPVDSKLKGQHDVIKSLYLLKKKYGINNIKYSLIGRGNNNSLKKIVNKFHLQDKVVFEGEKTHEEVFDWLKNIDIYIQPSYQEGLCRALIEAMSTGCPIITSNAGGNFELVNDEFMFKKGNIKEIARKISKMISKKELMINESNRSYELAKKYESSKLDKKRDDFYKKVINGDING